MNQKFNLISGLKKLKEIKPDPSWAKENKKNLIYYYQKVFPSPFKGLNFYYFKLKPVFATLIILGVFFLSSFSIIQAAKKSLPGEPLYPIKRIVEKAKLNFVFNKNQKNILRAEILTTRLEEARSLVRKYPTDSTVEKKLISVTKDIKSEINNLKNELKEQINKEEEIIFDEGDLPILDEKQVVQFVLSEDVKKALEETKKFLAEKNLENAFFKTIEVSKKMMINESSSTIEDVSSTKDVESIKKLPTSTEPIIKKIKNFEVSPDFGISPIKENFSTDILKE
jgi:hypothetical protein